jgi:putative restriction endonuclease
MATNSSVIPDLATSCGQPREFRESHISSEVKIRAHHKAFAEKVKANYGFTCYICGLTNRDFLVGAHIIPWAERKDIRLDPRNGLRLCALHDRAFEHGYIALTDNYKIIVRENVKNDNVLEKLLSPFQGHSLRLPSVDLPCVEYLRWHGERSYRPNVLSHVD